MVDTPTPAAPVAMTWAGSGEAIVKLAAAWTLGQCVLTNRRWNTLTDSDVGRTMELVTALARQCGIMAGTAVATPDEVLAAVKDMAVEMGLPVVALPQPTPAEPVVAPPPPPPPPLFPPAIEIHGTAAT